MTLVVDIRHWLDEHGDLPTMNLRLRRMALRIATLIEYGGPLKQLERRETMVPCKRRPRRRQCLGMVWVVKQADDRTGLLLRVPRRRGGHLRLAGHALGGWIRGAFLLADELTRRGAPPGPEWKVNVITSERLVTGQNPASATGVAEAVVALLADTAPGGARTHA